MSDLRERLAARMEKEWPGLESYEYRLLADATMNEILGPKVVYVVLRDDVDPKGSVTVHETRAGAELRCRQSGQSFIVREMEE